MCCVSLRDLFLFSHMGLAPHRNIRVRLIPRNMFKPSSNYLLTVSIRCFFCGSFLIFMFYVCLYYAVLSVPCSFVITGWERADLVVLLCVMFSCVLPFSHIVSRVRCGTQLYRFLIFAVYFTFTAAIYYI